MKKLILIFVAIIAISLSSKAQNKVNYTSLDELRHAFGRFYLWEFPEIAHGLAPFMVLLDSTKHDTLLFEVMVSDSIFRWQGCTCVLVSRKVVLTTKRRELVRLKKLGRTVFHFNKDNFCTIEVPFGASILIQSNDNEFFLVRY